LTHGTVTIVNGTTNEKIGDDIKVGIRPIAIAIDDNEEDPRSRGTVYILNSGIGSAHDTGTVSVINGTTNEKIGDDIKVGIRPMAIGIDKGVHTVYVANDDGTVSVIDGIKMN
jgi:DNA-binding beta-propeller fold protein YncE